MAAAYPLSFTAEDCDVVVRSRDFPELLTAGDTDEQAVDLAEDALVVVALTYLEKDRPLPSASRPVEGERPVFLPAQILAKIAVVQAWRADPASRNPSLRGGWAPPRTKCVASSIPTTARNSTSSTLPRGRWAIL